MSSNTRPQVQAYSIERSYAHGKIWRAQQQQEQPHQLEGVHKCKVAPPRFTGECSTFEEWKYKMTAYHGLQDPSYNRLRDSQSNRNCQLETANLRQQRCAFTSSSRAMDTTEQQLTLHLGEHMRWTSNLQTKRARQQLRDMAATTPQILHTTWRTKHWVPSKATQTTAR